jgi:hypothetical protein
MAYTQGEWRLVCDAQGPMMVMHPNREGVAIASLSDTHKPKNGFHDDWPVENSEGALDLEATAARIAERNGNARLIAAAPDLLEALKLVADSTAVLNHLDPEQIEFISQAIDKAEGRWMQSSA